MRHFYLATIKFAVLLCCSAITANAQDEPCATKWNQINTQNFRIIYPRGIDSTANDYANILESLYPTSAQTISAKMRHPAQIVLHPNNLSSNGLTSMIPMRMEFITTPYGQISTTVWNKSLAIHEFRHYVQFNKWNDRGIARYLEFALGEFSVAPWAVSLPNWFYEGDAVVTETAQSKSGRGRMSSFMTRYRTYLLTDKNFSYDKWMNGSYKNYIPNQYNLGYVMTAYARKKFGADVWNRTLERTQTKSFFLFNKAFRKETGMTMQNLQRESFEFLKNTWKNEKRNYDENINYVTAQTQNATQYLNPIYVSEDSIIAVKSDFRNIPELVIIDKNGSEKNLFRIGYYTDRIYLQDRNLYWIENISDARWKARSKAKIKQFNIDTKTLKTIASGTRYRTLAINNYGENFIVAAENTTDDRNFICILNKNFEEIKKIQTPKNGVIISIAAKGNLIAASIVDESGESLKIYDTSTKIWETLIAPSFTNIENIKFADNAILFESGFDGVTNLYYTPCTSGGKIYRLTNSQYGASMGDASKNRLAFSEYYSNGTRIAEKRITKNEATKTEVDWTKPYKFNLAETISAQENFIIDTLSATNFTQYESKPYSKAHLFKIHSWAPVYMGVGTSFDDLMNSDNDDNDTQLGATIFSNNILGNTSAIAGYSYKGGYSAGHLGFSYSGLLPVFEFEGHYGGGKNREIKDGKILRGNENRYNVEARIYVPISSANARYSWGITPSAKLSVSNSKYFTPSGDNKKCANLAEYSITGYVFKRYATADIFPRWGVLAGLFYDNSPFDTKNFGGFFGAKAVAYIPGLFANHGLKLSASYQKQNLKHYYIGSIFDFPRTYSDNGLSKKMTMFTADYAFPLAYPDANIGSLVYIKRMRANLFADYAINTNTYEKNKSIYNYGADLIFDVNFFRITYPISIGARIYTSSKEDFGAKLIFDIPIDY